MNDVTGITTDTPGAMDRKIPKKQKGLKQLLQIAIVGLAIGVGVYYYFLGDYKSALRVKREQLTISTVRTDPFQEPMIAQADLPAFNNAIQLPI